MFVLIVQAKLSLKFSFHFHCFMTLNLESLLYNQGNPLNRSVKHEHPKKQQINISHQKPDKMKSMVLVKPHLVEYERKHYLPVLQVTCL